jgi:hypothetical protein
MKKGGPQSSALAASGRIRRNWMKREHDVWIASKIKKLVQGNIRMETISAQLLAGAHDEDFHLLNSLAELTGKATEEKSTGTLDNIE